MENWSFGIGFKDQILAAIRREFPTFGPVTSDDGVIRLSPVECWEKIAPDALPLIPLKRFLLPPKEPLWVLDEDGYHEPPAPEPLALVGIAFCDLYGLACLDRVFAEDSRYLVRRRELFVVGAECTPGPDCFCPPGENSPPFDLFRAGERLWCGSAAGEGILAGLKDELSGRRTTPSWPKQPAPAP